MSRPDYAERRQARIDRLEARAERRRRAGEAMVSRASSAADVIPFGQPILVGHHSEKRDRRYRERIHQGFERGYALQREAERLERAAERARENTAIQSDDPEAVQKLREKAEKLARGLETMKAVNALIRQVKGNAALLAERMVAAGHVREGFSAERAGELLTPDCMGYIGFPPWKLKNGRAELRRLQGRIEALSRSAARAPTPDATFGAVTVRRENNRVQLVFPGKPDEESRKELKRNGFRWAPSEGAWQRHDTESAYRLAVHLAKQLGGEP